MSSEFSERPVVCRCNTSAVIKLLKDQWFVRYSDPDWKDSVKTCIHDRTKLIPPELESEFLRTVDWLNDWACTRKVGLGTPLPWDPAWIIEPLSDSTIYMAYYTIAQHLKDIDPELLDDAVFDRIFLQKNTECRVDPEILKKMQEEFMYWYPYDYRLSAKDLISNHLTFQLFHHTAIFSEEYHPRGLVVFGIGLLEGEKMSSSKGNVSDLRWYRRRSDGSRPGAVWTMRYILDRWVRLLAPFVPHITAELLEKMGKSSVTDLTYPKVDDEFVNPGIELEERLVEATYNDINEILKVTKITPRRIILYTTPEWKEEVRRVVLSRRSKGRVELSDVMRYIMENPEMRSYKKEMPKLVKRMIEDYQGISEKEIDLLLATDINEFKVLDRAKDFFKQEFGASVSVYNAEDAAYDPAGKSKLAYPMKAAIFVE